MESEIKLLRVARKNQASLQNLDYKPETLFWVRSRYGGVNPEGIKEFLALLGTIGFFLCAFFVFMFWK